VLTYEVQVTSVVGTIRPLRRGALFVCYQGHFRRSVTGSAPVNRAFDDWCFGDVQFS
jgi:hypothetical protein